MQTLIDFICNGATEFTPQVVVGLIVFSIAFECIGEIAHSILSVGRR